MGHLPQEMEALTGLDEDLLTAVLSLYRKDLAEAKTDRMTDTNTDDDLIAIELYLDDVESKLNFEKDHRLAQSIVHAKLTDFHAIHELVLVEQQDFADRQLARSLVNGSRRRNNNNSPALRQHPYNNVVGRSTPTLSKLAGLWISEDAGKALHPDNPQGCVDTERKIDEAVTAKIECAACGDWKSYFEIVEVPCAHAYCKDCIREVFDLSFHDESMFPPRCCKKPIKVDDVAIFLTKRLIEQFVEKEIEFNTADKTYCANKKCSKFIRPDAMSNTIGHCQTCGTDTCGFCKNEAHAGIDCPFDSTLQAVLDVAREEGWKRCDHCKAMVELRTGCYHITCRCGYQFCYLCGVGPWKNCTCEQWHDERLLERAQQVATRERRDVEQVREELITRHDCNHEDWDQCPGGECDECGDELPFYLYRCQQCRVEFCHRCRFNRTR